MNNSEPSRSIHVEKLLWFLCCHMIPDSPGVPCSLFSLHLLEMLSTTFTANGKNETFECVSTASEWNVFQHEKRNFISPSGHVMPYLLYQHQWDINPFHFCCERHHLLGNCSNGDLFTYEDNMLFSCVKISCFHAKVYLIFHWFLYNNTFLIVENKFFILIRFFQEKNFSKSWKVISK